LRSGVPTVKVLMDIDTEKVDEAALAILSI
jgi:hypothetical protein